MQDFNDLQAHVVSSIQEGKVQSVIKWLTASIHTSEKEVAHALHLLCAECYQLIGRVDCALSEINNIVTNSVTDSILRSASLLKFKMCTQVGDFDQANITLEKLNLPPNDIPASVLWRASLITGIQGNQREAERFQNSHRERVVSGGFQEANNILYTEAIPQLVTKILPEKRMSILDPIESTKYAYSQSTVDFSGRIGIRNKSLCQSLIVESYIYWEYASYYDSYKAICTAGLLLAQDGITSKAEGIGEIIHILHKPQSPLLEILNLCCNANVSPDVFFKHIKRYAHADIINPAYKEALDFIFYENKEESLKSIIFPNKIHQKNKIISKEGNAMISKQIEQRRLALVGHINEALLTRSAYKVEIIKERDPQKRLDYQKEIENREQLIVEFSIELNETLSNEEQIVDLLGNNLVTVMKICSNAIDGTEAEALQNNIIDLLSHYSSSAEISEVDRSQIEKTKKELELSVSTKLELTIPLIPFLLNYKIDAGVGLKEFVSTFFQKIRRLA